jgi:hypothetical protein
MCVALSSKRRIALPPVSSVELPPLEFLMFSVTAGLKDQAGLESLIGEIDGEENAWWPRGWLMMEWEVRGAATGRGIRCVVGELMKPF